MVIADEVLQQLESSPQHQVVEFAVPSQEVILAEKSDPPLGV